MRKGQAAPRVLSATMSNRPSVTDRLRQTRRLLTSEGASGVSTRLRKRAAAALAPPGNARLPIVREDLVRAAEVAAGGWVLPEPAAAHAGRAADRRLGHRPAERDLGRAHHDVPPHRGPRGRRPHLRRLPRRPPRLGHRAAPPQHPRLVPNIRAEVRDVARRHRGRPRDLRHQLADRVPGAGVARPSARAATASRTSSRPSTPPAARPCWPRPPTASASTRVTPARWLAQMLRRDYGMQTDHFDFGCDLETYALDRSPGAEAGARASATTAAPRRRAARTSSPSPRSTCSPPAIPRWTSTSTASRPASLPFRATDHGLLHPEQLNELYNRCVAGLVLSATNVSLVPHEMLAAAASRWSTTPSTTASCSTTTTSRTRRRRRSSWPTRSDALVEDRSPERVEAAAQRA